MSLAVKKTGEVSGQVYPPENVQLPPELFLIVYLKLPKLNDIRSLLQTNRHFNQCISADILFWKNFVKLRFPHSYQQHENSDNFKDVLRSLKTEYENIDDHKFRICSWKGHTTKVTCTAGQKDTFASGSEDGTVILWDRHTRKQLWGFSVHETCTSLAMTPDTVFAGFKNGTILGCNVNSGEITHEKQGDGVPIRGLQVKSNQLIYVSCGGYGPGKVGVWDYEKKELVKEFGGMANSVGVQKNRFLVGGVKLIQIMNENGDCLTAWPGHDFIVTGLTVQGDRFFSCTSDGDLKGWHIGPDSEGVPSITSLGQIQVHPSQKEVITVRKRFSDDTIDPIAREDKVFFVYDDIAILDFKNGKILYQLKSKSSTTSACMQDGMLFSGSQDGTLTIRDFNFPSLTVYDEHTLETNFALLGKIADKNDPLCKELHTKFAGRLLELENKFSSFNQVSLRLKIEVSLHLLLDRIHRGDQKRISEILALPIWNEMSLMDGETTKLYESIKEICLDQKELKTKQEALEFLKQKEQAVLKFIQHLKK